MIATKHFYMIVGDGLCPHAGLGTDVTPTQHENGVVSYIDDSNRGAGKGGGQLTPFARQFSLNPRKFGL